MLAKALANRLEVVMDKHIYEFQMVRVEESLIQEKVMIANELLDSIIESGLPGVLYKIYFTKAFDHVSWEFLVGRFGFGKKWRSWIKRCLSTTYFSILVNGSPIEHFKSSRGLHQEVHFFMLFVCVVEVLTRLILKA